MRLPHLDQPVPLDRGEAGLLARALEVLVQDSLHRPPMHATDALQLTPMVNLAKRLLMRHRQERLNPPRPGKRPHPRPLKVRYDEMAMMRLNRETIFFTNLDAHEVAQLRVIVGKFHQKGLNLAPYIKL